MRFASTFGALLSQRSPVSPSPAPAPSRPLEPVLRSVAAPTLEISSPVDVPRLIANQVEQSPDLERILALPRRHLDPDTMPADISPILRWQIPGPKARNPLPLQAHALLELHALGGILGALSVGSGKTLVSMLAPMMVPNCKTAVLLIPPAMRAPFESEWEREYERWVLPNRANAGGKWLHLSGRPVLWVIAYSELSNAKFTGRMLEIGPDLIIADEAHSLSARDSVRSRRLREYLRANPDTRFVPMSGTLTSNSIKQYAHLADYALGDGSPLPRAYPVLEEWADVIDEGKLEMGRRGVGALSALCLPGETVRQGFCRRLIETPGVIASHESSIKNSLIIGERLPAPVLPEKLANMIRDVKESQTRPDGEESLEELQLSRWSRQLACGFFYRWIYPREEPKELIDAWFLARKAFFKELRDKLQRSKQGADSPMLLEKAAIRWADGYVWRDDSGKQHTEPAHSRNGPRPTWDSEFFSAWREIRKQVIPQPDCVWLDDYLAEDSAQWAHSNKGIVWYTHAAFGSRVAELGKLRQYGAGKEASETIEKETGNRSIVASVHAHGTGKNLQYAFAQNLIANVFSDARRYEQLIGRTHRTGQPRDEVSVTVYRHTSDMREALERARFRAEYVQETTRAKQKLCYASYTF